MEETQTGTQIALQATILTGGARYWDRIKQNTKKSEDVWREREPDNEDERGDETDAFLMECASQVQPKTENKKQERANEIE